MQIKKYMKNFFIIIMLLLSFNVWGQESRFSIGINGGIGTEPDNSVVWGVVARYNITNEFRIAPEFNLSFREVEFVTSQEEWTNWIGSINLHYLFNYKNVSLYPIAGISFTNGKDKIKPIPNNSSNSMKILRLGGVIGVGLEYNLLKKVYINTEVKYSMLHRVWNQEQFMTTEGSPKNMNNFGLFIGLGYKF